MYFLTLISSKFLKPLLIYLKDHKECVGYEYFNEEELRTKVRAYLICSGSYDANRKSES